MKLTSSVNLLNHLQNIFPATTMGKVMSVLKRPLRKYNALNEAQKAIDTDKRAASPRHPTSLKYLKEEKGDAESVKQVTGIPPEHLDRLHQVFVSSEDVGPPKTTSEGRRLPQSKVVAVSPEYGYYEPVKVTEGKLTLRQAVELITRHQSDPKRWSLEVLSKAYGLDLRLAQQIILHFSTYDMWVPPKENPNGWKEKAKKFVTPEDTEGIPQIK